MSDLSVLFSAHEKVARWRAERENATARLEIALIEEHCAHLLSLHEPIASLGLDRERLRLALSYLRHGDLNRINLELGDLHGREANNGKLP